MDKKITNIKERVLYISECKGIAKETFFEKIGMTYGSFKGSQKKTALNSDAIDKLLSIYTDIDANWLLTGKGDMLKSEKPVFHLKNEKEIEIHLIPLYDGVMTASMVSQNLPAQTEPAEMVNAGDWFRDATAAMRVHGDSMYPDYVSGSIIAMKEVFNKRLIIYGQDYMIETSEYRVIKRLQKSDNPECWLMCSTNTEIWEVGTQKGKLIHEPQDIYINDALRVYQILGSVKRNHSSRVVSIE